MGISRNHSYVHLETIRIINHPDIFLKKSGCHQKVKEKRFRVKCNEFRVDCNDAVSTNKVTNFELPFSCVIYLFIFAHLHCLKYNATSI